MAIFPTTTVANGRIKGGSPSQADIEREVLSNFPNQSDRIDEASKNVEFSKGDFSRYPTRSKDNRYKSGAPRRTSPIMRRAVEVLTSLLYKASPTRKLADPDGTEWLGRTYKDSGMASKMKRADELTLITGFAAFQWRGTDDPLKPITCTLWGGDETAYWVSPDDATQPVAVAVCDKWDNQRRCRLYTTEQVVTYTTSKGMDHPAVGGNAYKELNRRANPYRTPDGRGILPFSFANWLPRTQRFETASPGSGLRELNDYVNYNLDDLGDSKAFNGKPLGIARNVDPTWKPPAAVKPGDFLTLPASNIDAGGSGPEPTLDYLQANLSYVEMDWKDLNAYLDHILEMNNVPPALIRMVQSGARSGVSIVAEQLPLLTWVEGRRPVWLDYEDECAHKCVEVASAHLRRNGMGEAERIFSLLADWHFTLRWPSLYTSLPGPEKDRSDDWRIKNGLASKVTVVMERQDLTEDEAYEVLLKVKEQNDTLTSLGIEATPPNPFDMGGGVPPFDQGNQQQQAQAGEPGAANG